MNAIDKFNAFAEQALKQGLSSEQINAERARIFTEEVLPRIKGQQPQVREAAAHQWNAITDDTLKQYGFAPDRGEDSDAMNQRRDMQERGKAGGIRLAAGALAAAAKAPVKRFAAGANTLAASTATLANDIINEDENGVARKDTRLARIAEDQTRYAEEQRKDTGSVTRDGTFLGDLAANANEVSGSIMESAPSLVLGGGVGGAAAKGAMALGASARVATVAGMAAGASTEYPANYGESRKSAETKLAAISDEDLAANVPDFAKLYEQGVSSGMDDATARKAARDGTIDILAQGTATKSALIMQAISTIAPSAGGMMASRVAGGSMDTPIGKAAKKLLERTGIAAPRLDRVAAQRAARELASGKTPMISGVGSANLAVREGTEEALQQVAQNDQVERTRAGASGTDYNAGALTEDVGSSFVAGAIMGQGAGMAINGTEGSQNRQAVAKMQQDHAQLRQGIQAQDERIAQMQQHGGIAPDVIDEQVAIRGEMATHFDELDQKMQELGLAPIEPAQDEAVAPQDQPSEPVAPIDPVAPPVEAQAAPAQDMPVEPPKAGLAGVAERAQARQAPVDVMPTLTLPTSTTPALSDEEFTAKYQEAMRTGDEQALRQLSTLHATHGGDAAKTGDLVRSARAAVLAEQAAAQMPPVVSAEPTQSAQTPSKPTKPSNDGQLLADPEQQGFKTAIDSWLANSRHSTFVDNMPPALAEKVKSGALQVVYGKAGLGLNRMVVNNKRPQEGSLFGLTDGKKTLVYAKSGTSQTDDQWRGGNWYEVDIQQSPDGEMDIVQKAKPVTPSVQDGKVSLTENGQSVTIQPTPATPSTPKPKPKAPSLTLPVANPAKTANPEPQAQPDQATLKAQFMQDMQTAIASGETGAKAKVIAAAQKQGVSRPDAFAWAKEVADAATPKADDSTVNIPPVEPVAAVPEAPVPETKQPEQMQPNDIGRPSDGKPFANKNAATLMLKKDGLEDDHEVVQVGKGAQFVVRPKQMESTPEPSTTRYLIGRSRGKDYVKITDNKDGSYTVSMVSAGTGGEYQGSMDGVKNWLTGRLQLLGDAVSGDSGWNSVRNQLKLNSGTDLFVTTTTDPKTEVGRVDPQDPDYSQAVDDFVTGRRSDAPTVEEVKAEKANQAKPDTVNEQFADNKLFTADKVAAARERLRKKLGTLNSGLDPELLIDGMVIAGAYIESGTRKFSDYAQKMIADMGDNIKPYLLSFWEGARNYPDLDTTGMTDSTESKRLFTELNQTVTEEMKPVVGEKAKPVGRREKKTGKPADRALRQDWGVDYITGRTESAEYPDAQQTDEGLKGGVKDAFLKDAQAYLRATMTELELMGYAEHVGKNGKPEKAVSVNPSGVAGSGDVSLTLRHMESGANLSVSIGETGLRGMTPHTKQGIAILFRASMSEGDRFATRDSVNQWSPVALSASEFSKMLDQHVQRVAAKKTILPQIEDGLSKPTEAKPSQPDPHVKTFILDGFEHNVVLRTPLRSGEELYSQRILTRKTKITKDDAETYELPSSVEAWRVSVIKGRRGFFSKVEPMTTSSGSAGNVSAYFGELDNHAEDALGRIVPSVAKAAKEDWQKAQDAQNKINPVDSKPPLDAVKAQVADAITVQNTKTRMTQTFENGGNISALIESLKKLTNSDDAKKAEQASSVLEWFGGSLENAMLQAQSKKDVTRIDKIAAAIGMLNGQPPDTKPVHQDWRNSIATARQYANKLISEGVLQRPDVVNVWGAPKLKELVAAIEAALESQSAPVQNTREKLLDIAKRLRAPIITGGNTFNASVGGVVVPTEDQQVESAISADHVLSHELGHFIMMKVGQFSYAKFTKARMAEVIPNFADLVAASKAFRPAVWSHASQKIREHARKNDEIIADAIASVLMGSQPIDLLQDLMDRTGLIAADLGLPKSTTEVKTNEPTELGQPSTRPLEGIPADSVQGTEGERPTGSRATAGSRDDLSGDGRTGESGLQRTRSVGDGSPDVSVSTGGSRTGSVRSDRPSGRSTQADARQSSGSDLAVIPATEQADDFALTEQDNIGSGGAKTKFKGNVEAIRILKTLMAEGRKATREEQRKMAKFVGWGGLQQAFRRDDGSVANGWAKEVDEIESLLTPDEYKAAVDSSIAAHYTSPEIVNGIWDAVKQLGFTGGRVLEPSMGSGNFFGMMPKDLRKSAQLHGVELDNITGHLAQHLYPEAKIKVMGFQDYAIPDGHFDLAIGNPPFGAIKITDSERPKLSGLSLHNYFFAKSVDALAENGVLAMVVTNRLLDASNANDKARQYMAERTEFLGAIRLPNNAFAKNAGTEVTTDIIFLRKLTESERMEGAKGHAWVNVRPYTDKNGKQVPLNEYFHKNPSMMLGEFGAYGSMYTPDDPALVAREGQNTPELMAQAIAKLPKAIMADRGQQEAVRQHEQNTVDIPNVKVGSMFVQDGQVYVRQPDQLGERQADSLEMPNAKALERVTGMIDIRDALNQLRQSQLNQDASTESIDADREALNKAYDAFVKKNGYINSEANKRLFRDDPSWPQLSSLEDSFDKGISAAVAKNTGEQPRGASAKKAAIFDKRTQFPYAKIESVTNAKDGLVESLNQHGRLDIDFIAELYGKDKDAVIKELGGLIYQDPVYGWVTADEYLSGNVKKKLAQAKDAVGENPDLQRNIDELEKVQPADIEAVDIEVRAGSHWVPSNHVVQFIKDTLEVDSATATYNEYGASWDINTGSISQSVQTSFGTPRASAANVMAAAINGKQITIYDRNDDGTSTVNAEATAAANEKIEAVKRAWADWIWQDDGRRTELARIYNDTFNTNVQPRFEGSHLSLLGKVDNTVIELRPHQADAIWRITQTPTALLDHVVGAGKTFTMIGAIMELRRMGKATKPMLIVPNHLVGQWAADFLKLYPSANILAANKKDFEKNNRKRLFARIATGDWDAVIVAHSSFGKVPLSPEEEAEFIKAEIEDMLAAEARDRKENGKGSRNAKDIAKRRMTIEEKLKKLLAEGNKDNDNLYWHELGVDSMFVDEAHEFKNLAFSSTMQRVAGLGNQKGSQKASDLFMKIKSIKGRIAGSKVVFATGTPISNTMAEMYTMQRYLDLETMQDQGIAHFDAWAKMFGQVVSDWELSPAGKYKMNSRFAKFVNMPELMQRYLSFADVINRDDINRQLAARGQTLGTPKIKGDKPQNIVVERSPDQADYIGEPVVDKEGNETYPEGSLVYRAENLPKKAEKGADNMLKIMSDARKAALDMRLIDPSLPDFEGSKTNQAVRNAVEIYKKWDADKGTQLIFCDLSTPKGAVASEKARIEELIRLADQGDESASEQLDKLSPDELDALNSAFSVYDDIKAKLIKEGIPEKEIAFIHDAKTEIQKEELFGKVKSGRVRILLGSTAKMGAGMNVQNRLVALHHLDAPWRPSDLEQREGRIIRQGNEFYKRDPEGFEIDIFRYATKQTLDSRMWQTLESKARFIEQVRKGDVTSRVIEDVGGEAANAAEMKAASSGNPLILEEMSLRRELQNLDAEKSRHNREQHRIKDTIRSLTKGLDWHHKNIAQLEADVSVKLPEKFEITIGKKTFKQGQEGAREQAGNLLKEMAVKSYQLKKDLSVGSYGDFKLSVEPSLSASVRFIATSPITDQEYTVVFLVETDSPTGLITKIGNTLNSIPQKLKYAQEDLAKDEADIPKLEAQIKPWGKADELEAKREQHNAIIEQLKPKQKPEKDKAESADIESATGAEMAEYINTLEGRASRKAGESSGQTTKQVRDTLVQRFGEDVIAKLEADGKLQIIQSESDIPADAMRSVMAWHGSPHQFDKFSLDHMGRGEGVQVYGWGLYFAGNRAVAEHYRKILSDQSFRFDGNKDLNRLKVWAIANAIYPHKFDGKYTAMMVANHILDALEDGVTPVIPDYLSRSPEAVAAFKDLAGRISAGTQGQLYKVNIKPDEKDFLLWDERVSDNADHWEKIQPLFKRLDETGQLDIYEDKLGLTIDGWSGADLMSVVKRAVMDDLLPATNEEVRDAIDLEGDIGKAASLYLKSLGIVGVKYQDQGSRTRKDNKSFNYVVFDDHAVEVLETMYSQNTNGIEGYFHNGKTVLIADNLSPDTIVPVLLHEMGGHAGFQSLLRPHVYDDLMAQFDRMVASGNPLAVAAKRRAESAESHPDVQRSEYLPYLITEASRAQNQRTGPVQAVLRMVKRMVNAVRAYLYDQHGVQIKLSADDIVALAERMVKQVSDSPSPKGGSRSNADVNFSRKEDAQEAALYAAAQSKRIKDWIGDKLNTMLHLALHDKQFRVSFDRLQAKLNQVSSDAFASIHAAPEILGRMETLGDAGHLVKGLMPSVHNARQDDIKAAGKALFEGTLTDKKVYTDTELRKLHHLNDKQVEIYRHSRSAIDQSLDRAARSAIMRVQLDAGVPFETIQTMLNEDIDFGAADKQARQVLQDLVNEKPMGSDERTKAEEGREQALKRLDDIIEKRQKLEDEGYAPLMRFGNHWLTIKDQAGETVVHQRYETEYERDKAVRQLKKVPEAVPEGHELLTGKDNPERFKLFGDVSPEAMLLFAKEVGLTNDEAHQAYLKLATANHSALRRLIHRKGIAGFSDDVQRVMAAFVMSTARHSAHTVFNEPIMESIREIKNADSQLQAQKMVEYAQDPREEGRLFKNLLFIYNMGLSVMFGLVNLTQPIMQTLPWLTREAGGKALPLVMRGLKQSMSSFRTGKIPDEYQAEYERAQREGHLDPANVWMLQGMERGKSGLTSNYWTALSQGMGVIAQVTETVNRRATLFAALQASKSMSDEQLANYGDAYGFAVQAIQETQGIYNKGNRPRASRGTVGSLIMVYKQFSIAYVEQMIRMARNPKWKGEDDKFRRSLMLMLALIWSLAGTAGLPFAENLMDVASAFMGWAGKPMQFEHEAKKVLGDDLADFIINGPVNMGPVVDVQGRTGMGRMLPATSLLDPTASKFEKESGFTNIFGASGGLLQKGADAYQSAGKGQYANAAMQLMPRSMTSAAKAIDMATTGEYRNAKGNKVTYATGFEALVKALDGNPARIADETRKMMEAYSAKDLQSGMQKRFNDQFIEAVAEKDAEGRRDVLRRIKVWNKENPEYRVKLNPSTVRRKLRDKESDWRDRVNMPKGMQQWVD